VAGFLQAMATIGKAHDAYAAAPDAREAFRLLAQQMRYRWLWNDGRKLLAAHAKKHADDPLLALYRGEMLVQEEQYQLADRAFQAAGAANPEDLQAFRASRVAARYHTGRALSALAEIEPRHETFQQLVNLCLANDNLAQ